MVLFDLQEEGSGVVHCIHREAMLTLLESRIPLFNRVRIWIFSCVRLITVQTIVNCLKVYNHWIGRRREELISWLSQVFTDRRRQ